MTDTIHLNIYFTDLQMAGTVAAFFGIVLIILAMHRKRLRNRIQGLRRFTVTDRTPFSKKTETMLQRFGVILLLLGLLAVMIIAIRQNPEMS